MTVLFHDWDRRGSSKCRSNPDFQRGFPEVYFDHPKDVGYRRITYRRLPRKNLLWSWETLVEGRYKDRHRHITSSPAQAQAMGRCGQTMNLHRRAFENLALLGYIRGYWDPDGYEGYPSKMELHVLDPDALEWALPDGLDVWVTSRETGVSPVDEAKVSAPPKWVWESSWETPKGLPRWVTSAHEGSNGSFSDRPRVDRGVVGRLNGEPLVVADAPPVLVLVKQGSRRTLSTERSEAPSLRLPVAPVTFGLPDVQEALRENGMGYSYAAAKRWVRDTPEVKRVERGTYMRVPKAP